MAHSIKNDIEKAKEFIELWVKFDQICKAGMQKKEVTPEEEAAFLEAKSTLARKFQLIVDSVAIDGITVDRTYDVINEVHSLKNIPTLSEHALRNLENNWHDTYISLNRLLGHLEAQQLHVPAKEKRVMKAGKNIARSFMFLILIIILVLIGIFLAYILGFIK
ncbi:MAG: hypothetical protein ABH843_06255 [Candidatus Omnitrophota bacterium]